LPLRNAKKRSDQAGRMKALVGLGNPGSTYAETRHNIGFKTADVLAARYGIRFRRSLLLNAETARRGRGDGVLWLVKPLTFMNRSGRTVGRLLKKRTLGLEDLLIIHDDVSLDWGKLRIRAGGSDGGHNGLKSVIEAAGSRAIPRLRIGVGGAPPGVDLMEHVLGPFSEAQREEMNEVLNRAADAAECFLKEGVAVAMNRFNA